MAPFAEAAVGPATVESPSMRPRHFSRGELPDQAPWLAVLIEQTILHAVPLFRIP
jgi:hypothetical protein